MKWVQAKHFHVFVVDTESLSKFLANIKHYLSNILDMLCKQCSTVLPRHKTLFDSQNLIAMFLAKFRNIFCLPHARKGFTSNVLR